MTRKIIPPVLLLLLLAMAPAAFADGLRFELGFGWTFVSSLMDSSYVNTFQPPFVPADRYIASAASQTVVFKGGTTVGMNGFFNLFFGDHFGLQVLADYHNARMGGSNTPYSGYVQYRDIDDVVKTYSASRPWQDSSGNLTETVFSLNALARIGIAENLDLSVSGGPSLFNFEGKTGYLGYTYFVFIPGQIDSTLTGETYFMVVNFGPETNYGWNLGVEATFEIFRSILLGLDLRWYGAPAANLQMSIVEDDVYKVPIDVIESTIGLGSLSVNPSYFRLGMAIRFVF